MEFVESLLNKIPGYATAIFGRTCCGHLQGASIFCSEIGGSRVHQEIGAVLIHYFIPF